MQSEENEPEWLQDLEKVGVCLALRSGWGWKVRDAVQSEQVAPPLPPPSSSEARRQKDAGLLST